MHNSCLRCGYTWSARSKEPLRCPNCKSIRWNKKVVKDSCLRCGAEWIQRGEILPKYCPVCHSSMWNAEKQTYTCPKCGKTRILRSNSRTDLCPSCDQYSDRPQKIEAIDLRGKGTGINTVIHLWSDNRGMVLNYTQNDHNIATLYECGKLVGTINISAWCRSQGAVFSANAKHQDEKLQKIYESAVEKILFSSEVFDRKTENISTLRNVDPITAKVISLHEEGMDALPIALRLGIAFTEVMDILATIPPIVRGNDLNRHVVEHKISGNDTNFPKLSQKV